MSVGRQIFYNTLAQSVGKILSVAIGLVTVALLTRHLGDAGFGEYTTVISLMGFFGILADLGLYLVTTREISKEGADQAKILGSVFTLRFVTVVSMLVVGALVSLLLPYSQEVKQAMFLGIAAFSFVSGTQVLVGVFQKHLVFYKLTASEVLGRLFMLAGVWLGIKSGYGIIYFVASLTAANGIHFAISYVMAQKIIPFALRFDFLFWKEILIKSWPLGFSVVLNLIYFRADTLILSILKPSADVGVYGLSYKILEILIAFPAMFAGLMMPFLSRYAFKDWDQYKKFLQRSVDAVLLVIMPMVLVTLFFARPIINVVGGTGFADADRVLQLLIFAAALIYIGNLLGYTVVALDAQKKMLWGYLAGSVVGLILYFVLIPKYSYFGAAAGTVAVELIVFVYAYFLTSKVSGFYPRFTIMFKTVLAAIPMLGVFYYFDAHWISSVLLGLILYCIGLFLLKAVPTEFIRNVLFLKNQNG